MAIQGVVSADFNQQVLQGTLLGTFVETIEYKQPFWKKLGFEEKNSSRAYEEVQEFSSLGPAPEKEELGLLKIDVVKRGYVIRINQTEYGVMMPVSKFALKVGQVEDAIRGSESIAESLVLCQELRTHDIFGNAFSTTEDQYPDALPLCATTNKLPRGGTYSNRQAAASLTETSIEAMLVTAAKMPAGNGYPGGVTLKKIVGPVEYIWRAKRQLKSGQDPNSANNAINAVKDENLEYVGSPHMQSTSNWFGTTDAKMGLTVIWVFKPEMETYEDKPRKATNYQGYQAFGAGCFNKRAVIGVPL